MIVDIDWVLSVRKRLSQINTCDIEDITWVKGDEEVEFSKEDTENWCFTGLNNTDIIFNKKYKVKEK